MTTAADDPGGEQALENAFEAYLAGRAVPAEGAFLASFAGAVRATATQPGRPNAALAELLATGLLVDQPPLSARTAKRRRRPMWFFTALIAKIASAGAVAQAATGAGIVLVGFTGLGAAGALPAPVQHTFTTVVSSIAPSGGSDTSTDPAITSDPAAPTTDPAATPTGAADPTDGTVAGAPAATTTSAPKNFGEKVSEQAHNGGVDGQTVSSWAHERNAARKSGAASDATETEAPESETEAPDSETEAPDSETADPSETESSDDTQGDSEDAGSRTSGGHGSHEHG